MKACIKIIFLMLIVLIPFTISSCKHGCGKQGGTSTAGSTKSHNMGLNCMNCHSGTGDGEGCFEVGGTIYHPDLQSTYGNCKVDLYTQPNGQGDLVISLSADGKGNVYTGKDINWGGGLFPVVTSPDEHREYMVEPITKGACSSCHGNTTDRIFVN